MAAIFNRAEGSVEEQPEHYEIYKSEADALCRLGFYKKAVKAYTTALKVRPNDKVCLVSRSQCYLVLGETSKALQDAESSLAEDKNYHQGMYQKAEALFRLGDFEMALVYYHRGNKLRPELESFRLGIQKAQETIYNSVGTPDRVKLNTSGDLSFFAINVEKKIKRKGALCTITPKTPQRKKRPQEKRGNEKTIKQMLGDLYGDRKYLEKLLNETDRTTFTGKRINHFADDTLTYLDTLSNFWQQVKPIYARKYEARLALNRGRSAKICPHDYIYNEIERADSMMTAGNYQGALQKAQAILSLLDNFSEEQISSQMSFAAKLHSIIGNAYLEMDDLEKATEHHLLDLTIAREGYLDEAEGRALDNLGRAYFKSGLYAKAVDIWEQKLPISKGKLEKAWLCHELGKCYLELGKTMLAKDYAQRCLAVAEEAKDDRWKLHSLVLLSQADVNSDRLSSSLITFEKAKELAQLLLDTEAEAAINHAIDDVHSRIRAREDSGLFVEWTESVTQQPTTNGGPNKLPEELRAGADAKTLENSASKSSLGAASIKSASKQEPTGVKGTGDENSLGTHMSSKSTN